MLRFVENFSLDAESIAFLKAQLPQCEDAFFAYLAALNCSELKISAMREGSVAFPRVPCARIEGPLAVCQIIETTMLALCNYASLMTTNAARYRNAVGPSKQLLEFGLRRAQGPDGALSASRYAYMGGFDGTSNVLAAKIFGIPVGGTHAHSFVSAFEALDDVDVAACTVAGGGSRPGTHDLLAIVKRLRATHAPDTNEGELAAFTAYAAAFPSKFLALIDTYDTLHSGLPNFICVAAALAECGYSAIGVRLDSGDLAYLSKEVRRGFAASEAAHGVETASFKIVASNNINERVLHALQKQGHDIDTFGIGTHLVTCQRQPALGMVYKLVEVNGSPRIKLSQELTKVTIPGRKDVCVVVAASFVRVSVFSDICLFFFAVSSISVRLHLDLCGAPSPALPHQRAPLTLPSLSSSSSSSAAAPTAHNYAMDHGPRVPASPHTSHQVPPFFCRRHAPC